jgi:F420-non-reducing hydrogenase iron-sulfur subunit
MITSQTEQEFKPNIVGFYCRWCTHAAADLAGTSRLPISPEVVGIRVPCTGRVDPTFIIQAFAKGADGVLVGGCHFGDCHYDEGNYSADMRIKFLKKIMLEFGIEPERVRIEWISASESNKYAGTLAEFTKKIKELGPLNWDEHIKNNFLEKTV